MRMDLEAGRFFNPIEEEHAAAVAVIGAEVKDQLFPTLNPIGRTIYVAGYPVAVIGLSARKGDVLGQNQDNVIAVPITFVQKILTSSDEVAIYVRPRAGLAGLDATQDEVRTILRSLRKTPYRSDDPFGILGSEAFQALWKSLTAGALRADDPDLRHLARGRRDRDRQHHVRLGRRAHAGDRRAPRARRPAAGHPAAVPPGGGAPGLRRRDRGRVARRDRRVRRQPGLPGRRRAGLRGHRDPRRRRDRSPRRPRAFHRGRPGDSRSRRSAIE